MRVNFDSQIKLEFHCASVTSDAELVACRELDEALELTTMREKLIKIGAKVVHHSKYMLFQMAELPVPRKLFATIWNRIQRLRAVPAMASS